MAVANLYHVTETLSTLLGENLTKILGGGQAYNVTTKPPELLTDETNTVNLFLYHIAEDPTYKNQPIPGAGPRGTARTPMALVLYYIATAHHTVSEEFDAESEQKLMGATLKTFHDFPIIDSKTAILGSPVMPETMAESGENWIEITLRPITPEEALHFWASEQSQTTRLSAYFEVRCVFLTPEEPDNYHGTVLSVGSYVTLINAPVLRGSMSEVRFRPPASMGLPPRSSTASPARLFLIAPADNGPGSPASFTLQGSNLQGGRSQQLLLRHPEFMQLDPPMRDIPIDPAANTINGWHIESGSEEIAVRFGSALSYTDPSGNQQTLTLFPGSYMIALESTVDQYQMGHSTRPMTETSNYLPVMVGTFIASSDQPNAGDSDPVARRRFELALSPAFNIARDNTDPIRQLDVSLVIDGVSYERVDDDPALAENGQFCVNATPAAAPGPNGTTLYDAIGVTFRAHFDPDVTGEHAVRLIIDGVDANPFWLEVV